MTIPIVSLKLRPKSGKWLRDAGINTIGELEQQRLRKEAEEV